MDLNHTLSGLLFLFLCYFFGTHNGVEAGASLSPQENLELQKQLKLLNKPAIKSFMTEYGHIYDCVDFYKQPAFDHPLLKNHSYHFQMKPQFPVEINDEPSLHESIDFGLKDGGCPLGTVPIRRTTKEDLVREKLASKLTDLGGTFRVVSHSKNGDKYTGALAFLSVYNPQVQLQQYSAARIQIQNEDEFIQFGWRVDPTLYNDGASHFYVQTNVPTARCFDAKCGFVVTSPQKSPGFAINQVSIIGKAVYELKPRVQRDNDGNWWLSVGRNNEQVGFWPSKLFTNLTEYATYVDWGGEVSSPHFINAPPMGSGVKPYDSGNYTANAYFRWMAGIDLNGKDFNPKTDLYGTDPDGLFYDIVEDLSSDPVWGHQIYFGGRIPF